MNGHLLVQYLRRVAEIDGYREYLISSARRNDSTVAVDSFELTPRLPGVGITRGLRKRLDYSSIIVALYGVIEDYVEQLVEICADDIGKSAARYQLLPAKFRASHERLTTRLLDQAMKPNYWGHLNVRRIVENLNGCLRGDPDFRINAQVYSLHSSNIRHGTVREMFGAIGITAIDQSIANHEKMIELLTHTGREGASAHYYIDDLADRRNTVAHGEAPQDVLSLSTLMEYIAAAKAFGIACYECALIGVLGFAQPRQTGNLGKPTKVFQNGRILCFLAPIELAISIGDRVAWPAAERWRVATIDSIEIDKVPHESVRCMPGTAVGIGISSKGNSVANYWLVSNQP